MTRNHAAPYSILPVRAVLGMPVAEAAAAARLSVRAAVWALTAFSLQNRKGWEPEARGGCAAGLLAEEDPGRVQQLCR